MPSTKSIWAVFLILLAIFLGLRVGDKLVNSLVKQQTA